MYKQQFIYIFSMNGIARLLSFLNNFLLKRVEISDVKTRGSMIIESLHFKQICGFIFLLKFRSSST